MPKLLGPAEASGVIAPAGSLNAGKWTVTFDPHTLGISLPRFECYHIAIKNGPPGSTFTMYVGTNLWDSVAPGDVNSWDPNQTLKLQQGQTLFFYWNTGTGTAPDVTLWLQEASPL